MQSDAFPTPPIYAHHFQPRLVHSDPDEQFNPPRDSRLNHLLDQIELLMTDCSTEESRSFWSATDHIKIVETESLRPAAVLFDQVVGPDGNRFAVQISLQVVG